MAEYSPFTEGDQPCDNFTPQMTYLGPNEHECWCVRPRRCGENVNPGDCHGTVSFCLNCHSDHHSYGYDKCPTRQEANDE